MINIPLFLNRQKILMTQNYGMENIINTTVVIVTTMTAL